MKPITFKLPPGVQVPDGKVAGDTFQAMTTYMLMQSGMVQLTEVDGEPLDGSSDQDDAPNPNAGVNTDSSGPSNIRSMMMGGAGAAGGQ